MSTPAIHAVLSQLRAVAAQSGLGPAPDAAQAATGGFAGELKRSLDGISRAQEQAYAQAQAYQRGDAGVALNDVMVDLQKANIALQTGIQVRNRFVAAYQEIMNLPA